MSKYEILKMILCFWRHKNNVCIKFGIVIFVCIILCFACFFVEKGRDKTLNRDMQNHNTAKLIQIRGNRLAKELTKVANDISWHQPNDMIVEASGSYIDTTELIISSSKMNTLENVFDTDLEEGIGLEKISQDIETSEPSAEVRKLRKSDYFIERNNIEKLFGNVPKFSETQEQNFLPDLSTTTISSDAIESSSNNKFPEINANNIPKFSESQEQLFSSDLSKISTISSDAIENQDPIFEIYQDSSENFEDNQNENLKTEVPSRVLSNESDSEESYFTNEYEPENDIIVTDYDIGDFIEVEEADEQTTKEVNFPSIIESLFGKMSTFFTPITPPSLFKTNKLQNSPTHLSNFKEIPSQNSHLRLGASYNSPIWKQKSEKLPLSTPLHARLIPSLHSNRNYNTDHAPAAENNEYSYSSHFKNSLNLFKNFLHLSGRRLL